jgi:hypothetical protein
MHKIIKEQESGWWVVYQYLDVMKSYLGSYKTKQSAIQSHPQAKVITKDSES